MSRDFPCLSWTNKRRVDSIVETYNKLREWVKPKAEEVVSKIEITKVSKPKKEQSTEKKYKIAIYLCKKYAID